MVSVKIRRTKPSNEALIKTIRELNKQRSRLEQITHTLRKRDRELFEICKSSLEKGHRKRAAIYANEVAEIRKTLSLMTSTKLLLERTILRLETIKEISPTLYQLSELFSNVKGALKTLTHVIPLMSPEMDALNEAVGEILGVTQPELLPSIEPTVIRDEHTEAIIQQAAGVLEEELIRKIPEPPSFTPPIASTETTKPMVALTTSGAEVYESATENSPSISGQELPSSPMKNSKLNSLFEELVLDYIYRNKCEIELARCAEELGISQNEILNVLDVLRAKGKIRIEQ
ncbi:MAG: hypothetical protein ACE5NN_00290 [Candidatus Bathyarchaeia archaeon]